MDKDMIEKQSILALENVFIKNKKLITNFNSLDKNPSFDGEITIYKNEKHTKSNIMGFVDVQIKGHEVNETGLDNSEIKFSVNISDLKNFLLKGGCMYFVVYLTENGKSKIYYSTFPAQISK